MWCGWVILAALCARVHMWPSDSDCLAGDGRVGQCTSPAECISTVHSMNTVLCRYSRGYGMRICCPNSSIRSHQIYATADNRDDVYVADQPIYFPSDSPYSTFNPFAQHITPSHNNPSFINNQNYNPPNFRPSHNGPRPQYHEKPSYGSEPLEPSNIYNERPRPSYGQTDPYGSQTNPGNNQQNPSVWAFPEDEYKPNRKTTPRPTWSLEDASKGSSPSSNKRISEKKCEEYSRPVTQSLDVLPLSINSDVIPLKVEKCDFSAVKLIVGGAASDLGEFPHMAALGFRSSSSQTFLWNCGGTLISERYVMTAGHCVNTSNGNPVVVRLGEYNLAREDDGAEPVDYGIEKIVIHPNYFKSLKYNDIALIKLSRPVRFNKWIRPACLPKNNMEITREKPIATGWGRTEFAGKLSDVLMKVSLSIVNNRECNSFYSTTNPGSSSFPSGIVDTMLCAGEIRGGRDTCLGDSGGPLTVANSNNPCIHYVIGITSFGKICAAPNSPGVYTKVLKYLTWIERTVWS